jgi:hypothetical protein
MKLTHTRSIINKYISATILVLLCVSGIALSHIYLHEYSIYISPALAIVIMLIAPMWGAFTNAARLKIEVNHITRTESENITISLDEEGLGFLKQDPVKPDPIGEYFEYKKNKIECSQKEVDELMSNAKKYLKYLIAEEQAQRRDYEDIDNKNDISEEEFNNLNANLDPQAKFDEKNMEETVANLRRGLIRRAEKTAKIYEELRDNIILAEKNLEVKRKYIYDNMTHFTISALLTNRGGANTAIRIPALLRVYVGEGYYIDIKFSLSDYHDKSSIPSNGSRVVEFKSEEVSTLPKDDLASLNRLWGLGHRSHLFIEDIHSNICISNAIAFVEGFQQKTIYGRLSREASTKIRSKW